MRSGPVELAAHLGPAARLAIDNERLRATMLAHLAALRASRARIVESSDQARRRLERDLHDGAQQRLLAAVYQLRISRAAAQSSDASAAADGDGFDELLAEATAVLAELRDLAHGIFPAIIDEGGLEPALQTLADRAPVVIDLSVTGPTPPLGAARAAYHLVEAATAPHRSSPGDHVPPPLPAVRIRVDCDGDRLLVDVAGAATVDYLRCADRIGALGGHLVVQGRQLRAEIPCE
jgi:hypothetical protein